MLIRTAAHLSRGQSGDSARQIDLLRCAEITFTVAGQKIERGAAACGDNQIRVTAGRKCSCRNEIRSDRDCKHLDVRQKWRRKFSTGHGLERSVALRREGIDIAAMNGD